MKSLATLLVLLFLAALAALLLARLRSRPPEGDWPFYARRLMSPPEQVTYFRLRAALPDLLVCPQVQLSRLLGVKRGHPFQLWHNRICQMSVDFALCTRDARILAVIEIDDASHDRPERRAADEKKDRALSAAGIAVHRWRATRLPDEASIRAAFASLRPPPATPTPQLTVDAGRP